MAWPNSINVVMHSYEMCHLIAREKTYTLQAFKEKVSGKIYEPKKNVTGI
jgi:hypothetical protein